MENKTISDEYLRGLVEGEGCFTFCNIPVMGKTGKKFVLPAFTIQMHERDKSLIELLKLRLGLKNKIYVYKVRALMEKSKIYRRGPMAKLIVRDVASLKNKIVPFFMEYNLKTYKRHDFKIFAEVVTMMFQKRHLNERGRSKILRLISNMNRKKKR